MDRSPLQFESVEDVPEFESILEGKFKEILVTAEQKRELGKKEYGEASYQLSREAFMTHNMYQERIGEMIDEVNYLLGNIAQLMFLSERWEKQCK